MLFRTYAALLKYQKRLLRMGESRCSKPHNKDSVLLAHIRQVERENDNNYGVQKVYEELLAN